MNVRQDPVSTNLVELSQFGANPGALRSWLFLPTLLAPRTPLVVVLHGCTQDAVGFDHGAGWTRLAEQKGFAVLFAEQQRSNNANLCFNWFETADTQRDRGEALSIRQMIGHVVQAHGLDPARVFITGLSAGGAMANVMLAAYPDVFAGGAIIGGLPFGLASGVGQAFERMQGRNAPDAAALRSTAAAVPAKGGGRPTISIWHGTHDQTVRPVNAEQIGIQWSEMHGVFGPPQRVEALNGHQRRVWLDGDGNEVIELYLIKGMAHGVPLSSGARVPLGNPGPFMLEAGISSTARIARRWGLADDADLAAAEGAGDAATVETPPLAGLDGIDAIVAKAMRHVRPTSAAGGKPGDSGLAVGKVITDALRAAGLMR